MIGIGIGINRLRGGAFSPATLFSAGEQGALLDPSDLSTLFQDTAGATPVTTPGQSDALTLDKSQGLVLGPELGGTAATLVVVGSDPGNPPGEFLCRRNASSTINVGARISGLTSGRAYKITVTVAANGLEAINLANIVATRVGGSANSYSIGLPGDYTVIYEPNGTNIDFVCTPGSSVIVSNISVRLLPGNHAVQSTGSFQPKYQITPPRLNFDGVDDRLTTTLNPTTSGSIAVRMRSNTASKVAVGSQPASDGRCYLGLASDGSLAGGIGTQATSVIVDQQADRRNILTYTEQFDNAAWPKTAMTASGQEIRETTGNSAHVIQQNLSETGARTFQLELQAVGRDVYTIWLGTSSGTFAFRYEFSTDTISVIGSALSDVQSEVLSGGWVRFTGNVISPNRFQVSVGLPGDTFVGDPTKGFNLRFPQLETGSTAYQPILGAALRDIRGVWTTGILTWDGSTVALHVDGEQVYSAAQSGAVNTTIPFMVGGLNSNGTGAAFHAGDIARAIVINRVLTAGEIASLTALWSTIE